MDYLSQQSKAPTSESHGSPGGFLCLSFHFCGFYLVSLRNLSSCEGSNCEV